MDAQEALIMFQEMTTIELNNSEYNQLEEFLKILLEQHKEDLHKIVMERAERIRRDLEKVRK